MKSIALWSVSVVVMIIMMIVAIPKASTAFAAAGDLSGAAWSANIGWISFGNDGAPYGIKMTTTGPVRNLSGYAWSSNVGWVSFDNSACPAGVSGNCQPRVEWGASGGPAILVKGFARACTVYASGCASGSSLKSGGVNGTTLGGWDGFISLGDGNTTDNVNYGMKINTATGAASGLGWGSEVVGWVDFTGVKVDVVSVPEICGNGIDEDNNGSDLPCPPPVVEICGNGIDDDLDGLIDEGCGGGGGGSEICNNGVDDDLDGLIDENCPGGPGPEICGNGIDDDLDGLIDEGCGGPAALCTNISNAVLANMTPPILTVADLIANNYRQLPGGRCACQSGYVLNAQFQCVKPVYQEQ